LYEFWKVRQNRPNHLYYLFSTWKGKLGSADTPQTGSSGWYSTKRSVTDVFFLNAPWSRRCGGDAGSRSWWQKCFWFGPCSCRWGNQELDRATIVVKAVQRQNTYSSLFESDLDEGNASWNRERVVRMCHGFPSRLRRAREVWSWPFPIATTRSAAFVQRGGSMERVDGIQFPNPCDESDNTSIADADIIEHGTWRTLGASGSGVVLAECICRPLATASKSTQTYPILGPVKNLVYQVNKSLAECGSWEWVKSDPG
jgi:hypothetical protein